MDTGNNKNNNRRPHHCRHESWEEVMEPGELLEDCWFFGNLLRTTKPPRMLRSMSDPCTSSKCDDSSPPGKSYEETYAYIKKLNVASASECGAPTKTGNDDNNTNRTNRKTASSRLNRAPSLPTTFYLQEPQEDEEEVEFSMGKLIRQASMKRSENLPPRRQQLGPKVFARNPSSSMHNKMRRKSDAESIKLENTRPVSRWDLIRELQGFKNMDRKDRSSSTTTTDGRGPPVPKMGRGNGKKSAEDMKAQIKFWARAVASNVHQEC